MNTLLLFESVTLKCGEKLTLTNKIYNPCKRDYEVKCSSDIDFSVLENPETPERIEEYTFNRPGDYEMLIEKYNSENTKVESHVCNVTVIN